MVGLTFNSSNIHGLMDDNITPYKSMIIDSMRMNQDYLSEGSCNIPLN